MHNTVQYGTIFPCSAKSYRNIGLQDIVKKGSNSNVLLITSTLRMN